MTGSRIALDTNRAITILNRADEAQKFRDIAEVFLPVPVVGELRYGALNSQHSAANLERITRLVSRCQVLGIDTATAEVYSQARLRLKQKGRPIPENDLWIAAICIQHSLPLATSDSHFLEVEDLIVEQ